MISLHGFNDSLFLQVYDDKIGDLLDPTQRDLEVGLLSLRKIHKYVLKFCINQYLHCLIYNFWFLVCLYQIKDDPKSGFYVENLTEEYVSCYEDVTQILIKVADKKI